MTVKKDIQSLIAAIDGILPKTKVSFFGSRPNEVAKLRGVLEQVRTYLGSLEQEAVAFEQPPAGFTQEEAARQIYLAVVREIDSLRANLMQPLQAELEDLRQQRESLVKEIRQMETQRHYYESLTQQQVRQEQVISEFLQVLRGHLQESLTQQMNQTLESLEAKLFSEQEAREEEKDFLPTELSISSPRISLHPMHRLEQMQHLQAQSDQLLTTLDSTLRVVFDALQRNLHSYQDSLSQGMEKMHNLGQQSEVMFTAWFNHLDQQLRTEALKVVSTTSINTSQTTPNLPVYEVMGRIPGLVPKALLKSPTQKDTVNEREFPYPGMEFQKQQVELVKPSPVSPLNEGKEAKFEEELPAESNSEDYSLSWESLDLAVDTLGIEPIDDEEIDSFIEREIASLTSLSLVETETRSHPVPSANEQQPKTQGQFAPENIPDEIDDLYQSLLSVDIITVQVDQLERHGNPIEEATAQNWVTTSNHWSERPDAGIEEEAREQGVGGRGDSSGGDSTPPEREPLIRSGGLRPMFRSASQQGEWVISPRSLPPSPCLFVEVHQILPVSFDDSELLMPQTPTEKSGDLEAIETIRALTDLFPPASFINNGRLDETSTIKTPTQAQQGQPEQVEDSYTPALVQESLLATEELDSKLDIEVLLNQDTMQQLSEDLSTFGVPETQVVQSQEEGSRKVQEEAQPNQQMHHFSMPDELLVEDWDDLPLDNWTVTASAGDQKLSLLDLEMYAAEQEVSIPLTRDEVVDSTRLTMMSPSEEDFDPDLFPSEPLHLDPNMAIAPYDEETYSEPHIFPEVYIEEEH